MKKEKVFRISLVLLFVVTSLSFVAAKQGEGKEPPHCVVQIEPVKPGEKTSEMSEPVCFDNFSDAVYFATDGLVRLSSSVTPSQVTEETLNPAGARRSTVIGQDYNYQNFGGTTITWTTSNPDGCSQGATFWASSMPSGWNNKVSSARSYQGCSTYWHYDYPSFGGSKIDCGWSCATMGAMDNQTESESWAP